MTPAKKSAKTRYGSETTTRVPVRDIMTGPVICSTLNDSIENVARKMRRKRVGSIVIVKNGSPAGIVYDRDIVTIGVASEADLGKKKARDLMQELHTIEDDADIVDATKLFKKHNVKRLGVMDQKKLVGVISISDVIAVEPNLVDVLLEKATIIRYDLGLPRREANISGYCDSCEEWSDYLQYSEGSFVCEQCREDASIEVAAEGA